MTAYQFVKPWLSKLNGDSEPTAREFANLRNYLKGIDEGTVSLFNPHFLNSTIDALTISGNIAMGGFKLTGLGAGSSNGDSLRYEQVIGLYLLLTGGTMSGAIAMGSNKITGLTSGTSSQDAANFGQYQQAVPNALDNGGFEVWQRGASFSNPASATYTADRWKMSTNEAATVTVTKETTTFDTGLSSMKVVTASTGASKTWFVFQGLENFADYRGRVITFSARVKTTVASAVKIAVDDGILSPTLSSYHTGSGNFETLTVTVTVSAGNPQLYLYIGMINAGDKKDGTYYFDSAMLAIGSETVAFTPTSSIADLVRCQRMYQVIGGTNDTYWALCQAITTTAAEGIYIFPVQMRTAPTATVNNATHWSVHSAAGVAKALASMTVSKINANGCLLLPVDNTADLVAGNATALLTTNADATITFTADL